MMAVIIYTLTSFYYQLILGEGILYPPLTLYINLILTGILSRQVMFLCVNLVGVICGRWGLDSVVVQLSLCGILGAFS